MNHQTTAVSKLGQLTDDLSSDSRDAKVTRHLRIFEPHPGLFAYYDGRIPGQRFMAAENWVDDGAISLGIASYALVSGARALIYDTHVSVPSR